ncbi:hypothetical protein B0H13DRAFT_2356925 [Mycena leptocephala]|nr:hypothetical protein B0H13DRAFT_2356925 [Mycena leptocephala]
MLTGSAASAYPRIYAFGFDSREDAMGAGFACDGEDGNSGMRAGSAQVRDSDHAMRYYRFAHRRTLDGTLMHARMCVICSVAQWAVGAGRAHLASMSLAVPVFNACIGDLRARGLQFHAARLALRATRTPTIAPREYILYPSELGISIAFDVEVLLRFLAALPD